MADRTEDRVRYELWAACQIMDRKGLVEGFGHISYRFPGTDRVMMTPRNGPGMIKAEEMLVLDLEGNVIEGSGRPALEYAMHSSVYRRRPEVRSICRTHSPMVNVMSLLGQPIRPVHGFGAFLGIVPVYQTPFLITNRQLGDALAQALGDGHGVVMRGNGCITTGEGIQESLTKAAWLEETCRLQVTARSVGEPRYLADDEIDIRVNVGYDVWQRAWEYWENCHIK